VFLKLVWPSRKTWLFLLKIFLLKIICVLLSDNHKHIIVHKINIIKKRIVLIMLCPFVLVIYSCESNCSKTVPCAGYNDGLLDSWFPYKSNQKLIFKNSANAYDTFDLRLTDSTSEYQVKSTTVSCEVVKALRSTKTDSSGRSMFNVFLSVSQAGYSTEINRNVFIYLYQNNISGVGITENGFDKVSFNDGDGVNASVQNFSNYNVAGNSYPTVQVISRDTFVNKKAGVYKFILAKNNGIVSYEKNPGGIIWVKQ
jgi:hypothetical protein